MFCSKCGSENKDDALFCSRCGAQLMSHEHEQTVTEIQEDSEETSDIKTIELSNVISKKKNIPLRVLVIIVAIVVLAAIAWVIVINVRYMSSYYIYNETNFNNGGRLAYDRSNLYIVGAYDDEYDLDWKLYSTDYDGNNKKILSEDATLSKIRLVGGKLYYVAKNADEVTYYIGSMNKDGSDQTSIISADNGIEDYDVKDGKIYYLVDSNLYVCSIDGSENALLLENANEFTIYKSKIYYTYNSESICVYDLKSGDTSEVCSGYDASNLIVYKGELYFKDSFGLYKASLKSNKATVIVEDDMLSYYAFYDGSIYYVSRLSTDEISALAVAFSDGDSTMQTLLYIGMLGTGDLYRASISNGRIEEVDSDYISAIYCYPEGMLCRTTLLSGYLTPLELE